MVAEYSGWDDHCVMSERTHQGAVQPVEPLIVQFARWLWDFLPQAVAIVGSALAAFAAAWLGVELTGNEGLTRQWWQSSPALVLWVGLLFNVGGSIWGARRGHTLSNLQGSVQSLKEKLDESEDEKRSAIDQAQQETFSMTQGFLEMLDAQLAILANQVLKLGDTERVSVYKYSESQFWLLCRYSKNPEFAKRGRQAYPDDQGCIGEAWHYGESYVDDLPEPSSSHEYEERFRVQWHIPVEVTRNFRMKSRSYAALAIEDRSFRRVAVIVFESTRTNVLKLEGLKSVLDNTEGPRFAGFIDKVKPFEQSLLYARERGF